MIQVRLMRWLGRSNPVAAVGHTMPQQDQRSIGSMTSSTVDREVPFYGLPRPPPGSEDDVNCNSSMKQRVVVALRSASIAFRDPTRDDAVAALGEVTGSFALRRLLQQMRQHPTGRLVLQDKPLVTKATIPHERFLEEAQTIDATPPDDVTFGQAYGHFLLDHGFDPDERKSVQHISGEEDVEDLAYVMMRYRQCHDYWHTLTGLPPTVLGELGLKWLELFQTGLPIAALSGTVGSLGLSYKEQHILWNLYLPWAIRVHQQQQAIDANGSMLTVYYEQEFDTPLQELRQRIGMEAAPKVGLEE